MVMDGFQSSPALVTLSGNPSLKFDSFAPGAGLLAPIDSNLIIGAWLGTHVARTDVVRR